MGFLHSIYLKSISDSTHVKRFEPNYFLFQITDLEATCEERLNFDKLQLIELILSRKHCPHIHNIEIGNISLTI